MFLVLQGAFDMQFRDKTVRIGEGEFLVVPRGVEHCPKAEAEVSLMLFEPAGTVNTGTAGGDLTVPEPERILAPRFRQRSLPGQDHHHVEPAALFGARLVGSTTSGGHRRWPPLLGRESPASPRHSE